MQSSLEFTPATTIRWRPHQYGRKAKNILVVGNSDGTISYWHASTGKLICKIKEENNHVLCMDYNLNGTKLATSGKDYKVFKCYLT